MVPGMVIIIIQKSTFSTCVASNVKNPKEPVARNKTNNDKLWWDSPEEIIKQNYYFAVLCGYSPSLHLPYKCYLDELEKQKNGNIFSGVGSEVEEDMSWLDNL